MRELGLEEAVIVEKVILEVHEEAIALLNKQPEHIGLVEDDREVHCRSIS
jgi:hypothetical protein